MVMDKRNDVDLERWGKTWSKSWRRRRNEATVWFGLFVLLAGVLWYAVTVGLIDLGLVCPGLLIIVGALFILKGLLDQIFNMQ